jgi:hypothetical protein
MDQDKGGDYQQAHGTEHHANEELPDHDEHLPAKVFFLSFPKPDKQQNKGKAASE